MVIGGIIYGYQQFKRYNTPVSAILEAVPEDAALVIETRNALDLWEKLTHTSVLWEDLKQLDPIKRINFLGTAIDSIIQSDVELQNELKIRKAMAVVVPSGSEKYDLLFGISTSPNWTEVKVSNIVERFLPDSAEINTRLYDETTIFSAEIGGEKIVHWGHKSGIVLICTEIIPLENALRTLGSPRKIIDNTDFHRVAKTAGLYADANMYVNHREMKGFLKSLVGSTGKNAPFFDHPLAGWAALDLTLKSNQIMGNGFVHVADSTPQYFNALVGQSPQEVNLTRILPTNTAYLMHFGLSHFPTFYKRYRFLLNQQNEYFGYDKARTEFNQRIDANSEDLCLSWIGSEMGIFITEPNYGSYDQLSYLAFSSADPEEGIDLLIQLSEALDTPPETYELNGNTVYSLKTDNVYGRLLGAPFAGFDEVMVTQIEDYVVIAQSKSAMRNLINYIATDNTLYEDDNFESFISNLGKRSNLLFYSGISRSPELYAPFLTSDGKELMDKHLETVRNFEGFAYQLVQAKDDLFYSNLYLRHNPVYTRESGAFWELALDAKITHGPQLVLNHYTQSREILVQDSTQQIHLISNTGKVLWSRKVDGEIKGRVQQIDVYKNNKLQLLFNTSNRLYLIDRNGNDVSGYPVKLPAAATAPLGLFDYDNSRDYRILIPLADRSLRMYDGLGKVVKGWKNDNTDHTVRDKPEHLRLGNKDYIFVADQSGGVYLLNRQGKHRHKVKATMEARSDNPVFITEGKNIRNSGLLYTDTLGNLVQLGFDNEIKKTQLIDGGEHRFIVARLNSTQRSDIVIATEDRIRVFDSEGDSKCSFSGDGFLNMPVIYRPSEDKGWIGVLSSTEEAIYLLNAQCKSFSDFPLFARGNFAIGDINKDGITNVVAIGEQNTIYTYNLE